MLAHDLVLSHLSPASRSLCTNKIGIINNNKLPLSLSGRVWEDRLRVVLAEGRPMEVLFRAAGSECPFS